jgi:c-type cytochrome biogenesis protein CcmF
LRGLQILGAISFCFHLFILLISNPFVQLQQVPNQGMGLNPLLEDPALAIHPPILYTGLALLSVLFAISCVGLKTNLLNKDWALLMRPWALACWSFLTLGIALGSWWAYYELGWGGWWFWDPVENLSLLPWLVITALVHSLVSVEKNDSQQFSAALLAVGGFLLALMSLFLVRSGALSSVHAFAVDPLRGGRWGLYFLCLHFMVLDRY